MSDRELAFWIFGWVAGCVAGAGWTLFCFWDKIGYNWPRDTARH